MELKKLVSAGIIMGASLVNSGCGPSDVEIAECLVDKGVMVYGYDDGDGYEGCPACKDQKERFGPEAWKIMKENYVDCFQPWENIWICAEAGVNCFPYWKLDEITTKGSKDPDDLAEIFGCD